MAMKVKCGRFAPKDGKVLAGQEIAEKLRSLIGRQFVVASGVRTNGAALRKMVSEVLKNELQTVEDMDKFEILPPKAKGVPKLLPQLIDTYIVTTGEKYNLQIWNRIPNSSAPMIKYSTGKIITSADIRIVTVKIDVAASKIASVIVMTPQYIETHFGEFGVPTIKNQLIISDAIRKDVTGGKSVFSLDDTDAVEALVKKRTSGALPALSEYNDGKNLFSLQEIQKKTMGKILNVQLPDTDTKTKGQYLERLVATALGYAEADRLVGGYPDIPNQLLEVKVQDSSTVDLGKYSPHVNQEIEGFPGMTASDVRYLIALTNPKTRIVEGIILTAGKNLGTKMTFVADKNYKCQRFIPMSFFDRYEGMSVFNPIIKDS